MALLSSGNVSYSNPFVILESRISILIIVLKTICVCDRTFVTMRTQFSWLIYFYILKMKSYSWFAFHLQRYGSFHYMDTCGYESLCILIYRLVCVLYCGFNCRDHWHGQLLCGVAAWFLVLLIRLLVFLYISYLVSYTIFFLLLSLLAKNVEDSYW